MRKKSVCRFGACLLMILLFFSNFLLCYGAGEDESEKSEPVIKSITISPESVVVSRNSTYAFTATVTGENGYNDEVAWVIAGQKSQNTFVDSRGVLYVGSDETAAAFEVKAVSKQDPNVTAPALVTLRSTGTGYSIQAKASPENGGTVSGSTTVSEGGYAVLSASPNSGYAFRGWSLNGVTVSTDSRYLVDNIHSDRTYVANFEPSSGCRINVTVNNSSAGIATESQNVIYGGSLTLEAAAWDGYRFDGWMENGTIISRDYRMQLDNITSSRDFVAVFSSDGYTLTLSASPAEAGAVSGQGTYGKGSNVKIIATPASGYQFDSWTENGSVVSRNQEYFLENIARDINLVANFTAKTYTINAGVSSLNGTIIPEGKSTVPEGGEITYTITPKGGYTVKAVYVDGKSVGAVASYSFTDVKGNHNISVDFAADSGKGNSSSMPTPEKDKEDKKDETDKADEPDKDEEEQEEEADGLTGTLRYLDISPEEAERLIDENNDWELMLGALSTGDLQVKVENDFSGSGQKTSFDGLDEASGVTNFEKVLSGILTRAEKMDMLKGDVPIDVNLQISDASGEEPELIVRTFKENKLPEREIVQYFEMSLTKSVGDDTQAISKLSKKLRVVINVPEHLKEAKRDFYILRLHVGENGEMEYTELADEDDSPDTISFATDCFSPYAIAYTDRQAKRAETAGSPKEVSGNKWLANIVVIAAIILAAGITFFLVFYLVREAIVRRWGDK